MNAKKFSAAMGELDGKYVAEALSYRAGARRPRDSRRASVVFIAAALAILLTGAAAACVFGTQIRAFFSSPAESGFDFDAAIERIPTEAFSAEIRAVGDVIRQQFQTVQIYDSRYPGAWQTDFSTRDQACAYIGLARLKRIDLNLDEQPSTLCVLGNERGEIQSLHLETDYAVEGMQVQFFSRMYTENETESPVLGVRVPENAAFEESFCTTKGNKPCRIVRSSALESGYLCLEGYIVDEGILYNLHIAYKERDAAQALELMHRWADLF